MADHKWELSKENIEPTRSGRRPSDLEQALAATETDIHNKKLEWETCLRTYNGDDPIEPFIQCIREADGLASSGQGNAVRNLCERAIARFCKDPGAYRNDPRLLYVWLKFAHFSRSMGSTSIYAQMKEMENCTELADFWVQWSAEVEEGGNLPKAADLLREGLRRHAQPIAKLERRQSQLEERVAAAALLERDLTESPERESTRAFMNVLKGVGAKKATPYDRSAVSHQKVKLGSSSQPKSRLGGFSVLDEEELLSNSKPIPAPNRGLPDHRSRNKENDRKPDVWTKQKIKSKSTGAKAKFSVYEEEGESESSGHSSLKSVGITGALKGRKDKTNHTPWLQLDHKKRQPSEPEGVRYMWDIANLTGVDEVELSPEETRAMRREYALKCAPSFLTQSTPPLTTSAGISSPEAVPNLTSNSTAPIVSLTQPTNSTASPQSSLGGTPTPVLAQENARPSAFKHPRQPFQPLSSAAGTDETASPMAKSARPLAPQAPHVMPSRAALPLATGSANNTTNASFTTNLRRDVYNVFGNTLQAATPEPGEEETLLPMEPPLPNPTAQKFEVFVDETLREEQRSKEPDQKLQVYPEENIVPAAPEAKAPAFQVFADDEEMAPTNPPIVNNENAGVPSKPQKSEVEAREEVFLRPTQPPPRPSPAAPAMFPPLVQVAQQQPMLNLFDEDEETLANFGGKLAAGRMTSTPCAFGALPSFSAGKPWEGKAGPASQQDNLFGVDKEAVLAELGALEEMGPTTPGVGRPCLYTIQETSRETFRSGSSIASAASSSGASTDPRSAAAVQRPLRAQSPALEPIQEQKQLSFGGCTTVATPGGALRPRTDSEEEKALPEPKAAEVEKSLESLTIHSVRENSNLEQHETTVFADLTCDHTDGEAGELNPWDPAIVSRVLVERGDDHLAPFPSLPSPCPPIRVGTTLELPNGAWKVEKLLGEGAFARAYKLVRASSSDTVSVLKVQKPACPWELYVCGELGKRVSSSGLSQRLGPALMSVDAAFLYNDGSFLLNSFLPNGTLLDLANRARQVGDDSFGVARVESIVEEWESASPPAASPSASPPLSCPWTLPSTTTAASYSTPSFPMAPCLIWLIGRDRLGMTASG